jgi:hypothetical protein
MRGVGFAVMIAVVVVGCGTAKRERVAHEARRDLVGLSRNALIECAGEPDLREMVGDREMLSYISDPEIDPRTTCVGTFVLRRDVVERLDFTSPAGRLPSKWERCAPIVENCTG